jgi:hypothetical protein
MRGDDEHLDGMFSFRWPEERIPADHPLRPIRAMVDTVLRELPPEVARLYPKTGRPSIPSEKLLRALLLQLLLLHPERAAADGATRLQLPGPLVRRPRHG